MKTFLVALLLYLSLTSAFAQKLSCARIVSLAPSLTESIFALGLGPSVVGVSQFDRYPQEVRDLPRVGALLNPNFEAVLALKPTLVLGLTEQGESLARIQSLGLKTHTLDQRSVGTILSSLQNLGDLCGKQYEAQRVVSSLQGQLKNYELRERKSKKLVKVLILIGNSGASTISNLFVSGKDGFYSELLSIVGGQNVFADLTSGMSALNPESLLAMNPEAIILISGSGPEIHFDKQKFLAEWNSFPQLDAVRNKRIYIFDQDYASIPGPRFVSLLPDFWQAVQGS